MSDDKDLPTRLSSPQADFDGDMLHGLPLPKVLDPRRERQRFNNKSLTAKNKVRRIRKMLRYSKLTKKQRREMYPAK